ncbi:hypothetical protein COB64_04230 [Candidatus Wolfebacteria bacterium]|nr:MAG: hypothetical protein COB64_04230 [Candidatus Wolfebacteria bacterium]
MKVNLKILLIPLIFSFNGYTQDTIVQQDTIVPNEYIIPNSKPDPERFKIPEGNCGEACLSTVFRMQGKTTPQKKINASGTIYNRGLHGSEIKNVVQKKNIIHRDISIVTTKYSEYVREIIIPIILSGNPILLGVKIYPDTHPYWSADHFILLVGYDPNTDKIFYNTGHLRRKISVNKLLNKEDGYSLLNKRNKIYAIQFAGSPKGKLFDSNISKP